MARGYGIGNFGDAYFGVTKYVDASASASVNSTFDATAYKTVSTDTQVIAQSVVTSAAVVTYNGIGLVYGNSDATSSGTRVREISSTVSASVSGLCNTAIINNIPLVITAVSNINSDMERVRLSDVTIAPNATATVDARYKFEPIAKDNESWTEIPTSGGTWSDVA